MKKIPLIIIALLLSTTLHAETIAIKAHDCGPLARGKLGVVFSVLSGVKKQTYFTLGNAMDLCPKIMSNTIKGYELGLCERNKPETPSECFTIKEFVILSYHNE